MQLLDPIRIATDLAARLASTAVERDRAGGHAPCEREWIRESGLLALSVPADFGGAGAGWSTVQATVRILARADSALAHVYAFHHLQMATIDFYGNAGQRRHLFGATVSQRLFWGNALNPLDKRCVATARDDGFMLNGIKSFCSGSVGADWLIVSAWDQAVNGALIGALPATQAGLTVQADWDAFGQKQTDSGNVLFEDVALPAALVLQAPSATPALTSRMTLRTQISQLIMANLYLGIGQGAFEAARAYTREQARPWFASGVARAADDPVVQHRYGKLWLLLRPAELAADHAAGMLDRAMDRGEGLTAGERGEVAIAVAEAKALSHQAGLDISNQMFELMGARSTSAQFGFDRFWRNARVHTLHDPVDYKIRDLGRYALDGTLPEPTAYS